jgi:hypothetical protein
MTTTVVIGKVQFSANNGVWAFGIDLSVIVRMRRWQEIATILAEEREVDVRVFLLDLEYARHMQDHPLLVDACCGGSGPLANLGQITYEEFEALLDEDAIRQETSRAKRELTRQRRAEFNGVRPQLALALLNAGHLYCCAESGCPVTTDLTIDHIVPLSRGGTDDLDNLRFLCRPHNSAKGDR